MQFIRPPSIGISTIFFQIKNKAYIIGIVLLFCLNIGPKAHIIGIALVFSQVTSKAYTIGFVLLFYFVT